MLSFLKNIMGSTSSANFKELVKNGAQIIDVRTPQEFKDGHIKGAVNIPLQTLENNLNKIKKDKPVITCCLSGGRSASAKTIFETKGYREVYNGGGWESLQSQLS